jgi:REP element-mobilizing transposase RayT
VPRRERYFLPDQPLHVIQRGNDRQAIFFAADDYARYRDWLHEAACRHVCAVHAYVLMTNHVHLLVTPGAAGSASGKKVQISVTKRGRFPFPRSSTPFRRVVVSFGDTALIRRVVRL